MKKVLSFISALALITCTFVSCGDKKSDSGSGSDKKSSSDSDSKKNKDDDDYSDSDGIVGTWSLTGGSFMEENEKEFYDLDLSYEFEFTKKEITINSSQDANYDFLIFDGRFFIDDLECEYEYDGESLIVDGGFDFGKIVFNRVDAPDKDNIYGMYSLDEYDEELFNYDPFDYVDFAKSNVAYGIYSKTVSYTYDEESGELVTTEESGEEETLSCKIKGNELTITDESGESMILTRAD